jgi:uncharacterized membrane protein YqaE (UPF0057 family)
MGKIVQIQFNNHISFIKLNKKNCSELHNQIECLYKLEPSQYYITSRSRLISSNEDFNNYPSSIYQVHIRVRGGGLEDIFTGLIKIFKMVAKIPSLFIWFFSTLAWIFSDLLNPFMFIQDLGAATIVIVKMVVMTIMDGILGVVKFLVNRAFNPIVSGFWGYVPDSEKKADTNSKKNKNCNKQRCVETPGESIPLPVLLSTVILPPLGLFMELGIKGWINILLCAFLTLFFYFPGLIYALIILYC